MDEPADDLLSAHVRALVAPRPPGEVRAAALAATAASEAIAEMLTRELRRRGLWGSPPAWLGVVAGRWDEPGALDDLRMDAWLECVVELRHTLAGYLQVHPSITPVIRRKIGFFVTRRQKQHDPVGYAVFKNLEGAILDEVEEGGLALAGGERVRNDSVLCPPPRLQEAEQLVPLDGVVDRHRAALAEAGAALGRRSKPGKEAAQRLLRALSRAGHGCFRMGALVGILKPVARAYAPVLPADDPAEPLVTRPGWEDWEAFEALNVLVRARVTGQRRLVELWDTLREAALAEGPAPSQAELAIRFGVGKSTMNDDFARLAAIVRKIQAELNRRPALAVLPRREHEP